MEDELVATMSSYSVFLFLQILLDDEQNVTKYKTLTEARIRSNKCLRFIPIQYLLFHLSLRNGEHQVHRFLAIYKYGYKKKVCHHLTFRILLQIFVHVGNIHIIYKKPIYPCDRYFRST